MIDFLSPLSNKVLAHIEVLPQGVIGKTIKTYNKISGFPDLKEVKFALIGVLENRNDINYIGNQLCFDAIRKSFYSLYEGNWSYKIADIGDIEKGETISDSYYALQTVVESLLKQQIIPIILGGSQDLATAQYKAYNDLGEMVNLTNIDTRFDLGDADQPITNISYVGKLIVNKPYNLFNYSVIGYQSFFNPSGEISLMEKLFFDAYRLGDVTVDLTMVEPVFRDSNIVTLDVNAIKSSELSYTNRPSPNGFNGKEICALSRYAGISNKVSSFGIFELKDYELIETTAMLIAQIIWYFIEGVNFRVLDDDFNDKNSFTTYKVPINNEVLIFKKSNKTGRWWIVLPFFSNMNNKIKRSALLPCTYGDYLGACNQEIPERWYKARRKNEV